MCLRVLLNNSEYLKKEEKKDNGKMEEKKDHDRREEVMPSVEDLETITWELRELTVVFKHATLTCVLAGGDKTDTTDAPWYKSTGSIAGMVVLALVIVMCIVWMAVDKQQAHADENTASDLSDSDDEDP